MRLHALLIPAAVLLLATANGPAHGEQKPNQNTSKEKNGPQSKRSATNPWLGSWTICNCVPHSPAGFTGMPGCVDWYHQVHVAWGVSVIKNGDAYRLKDEGDPGVRGAVDLAGLAGVDFFEVRPGVLEAKKLNCRVYRGTLQFPAVEGPPGVLRQPEAIPVLSIDHLGGYLLGPPDQKHGAPPK